MDSTWIRQVQAQVAKRARTFEVPGCRQSRRVEGMFDRDDEVTGFKHLCVYVDAGLVEREEQIAEILAAVDGKIYSHDHYDHTRWLMFFGIVPDRLVTPGLARAHHGIRATNWESSLRRVITADALAEPLTLPRLRSSEAARIRYPERYDLALFFCRSRELYVATEAEQNSFRQLGPRSLWFFFNGQDVPEMEIKGFIPLLLTGGGDDAEQTG